MGLAIFKYEGKGFIVESLDGVVLFVIAEM